MDVCPESGQRFSLPTLHVCQRRLTSATFPVMAAPRAWHRVVCRGGEPAPIMATPRAWRHVVCRGGEPAVIHASSRNPQFHGPRRLTWRHTGAAAWGGHPDPRTPPSLELLLQTPCYPGSCPGDLAQGTSPASPLCGGCWRVLARAACSCRGIQGGLGSGSTTSLSSLLVLLPQFGQNTDNRKFSHPLRSR